MKRKITSIKKKKVKLSNKNKNIINIKIDNSKKSKNRTTNAKKDNNIQPYVAPSINIQQPSYQPNVNDNLYQLLYNFIDDRNKAPILVPSPTSTTPPITSTPSSAALLPTEPVTSTPSVKTPKIKKENTTINAGKPKLNFMSELKNNILNPKLKKHEDKINTPDTSTPSSGSLLPTAPVTSTPSSANLFKKTTPQHFKDRRKSMGYDSDSEEEPINSLINEATTKKKEEPNNSLINEAIKNDVKDSINDIIGKIEDNENKNIRKEVNDSIYDIISKIEDNDVMPDLIDDSQIPITQDPLLNNQPNNESISDIYKDKSKTDEQNDEIERKNKLDEERKKFYENKQNIIIEQNKLKQEYLKIITDLQNGPDKLKTNDPLRKKANKILRHFNNDANIGSIKDKNKLINKLKENQNIIDTEIKKNEDEIKRFPPTTSGNIYKLNNSNETISNEFNNSIKQKS